jgi:hypothetical protein
MRHVPVSVTDWLALGSVAVLGAVGGKAVGKVIAYVRLRSELASLKNYLPPPASVADSCG